VNEEKKFPAERQTKKAESSSPLIQACQEIAPTSGASGVSKKFVANLWTEFAAHEREALTANGKEPQNPNKLVVAATFEMANTCDFAKPVIMNPTL